MAIPEDSFLDKVLTALIGIIVFIGMLLVFGFLCALMPWWPWCWHP